MMDNLERIKFNKEGLVPAIIQHYDTGEVLMLAYMNEESFKLTLRDRKTWFWSRSRQRLWNKGESSGHFQIVKSVKLDCDGDTLLIAVDQIGPACHTGSRSCFFTEIL